MDSSLRSLVGGEEVSHFLSTYCVPGMMPGALHCHLD